ncbi:MAG: tetratricopeptide repeat protein, partial [Bacillota bacterium]
GCRKTPAYRYLRPLRQCLLDAVGTERKALMIKAADCEWDLGETYSAINHYMAADAVEEAAEAISAVGSQLVQSGKYDLLGSWIEMLPPDLVRADPWLLLWAGLIKKSQGQLDTAQVFLEHALDAFRLHGDRYGIAEARLGLAAVLKSRGLQEAALQSIAMAVPRVAVRKHDLVPELMADQAYLQALCGFAEAALSNANEALRMAQLFSDRNVLIRVAADVSQVHFLMGDCTAVLRLRRHILRDPLHEGQSSVPFDSALARKDAFALAFRMIGDLNGALDHAKRSAEYKNDHGLLEALPSAYWQLGVIYADLNELAKAEDSFRRAIEIAEAIGGERLNFTLSLVGLSRVRCLEGRLIEAQTLADQALEAAKSANQSKYLVAACTVSGLIPKILAGDIETALPIALAAEKDLIQYGARHLAALNYAVLCFIFDAMGDHKRAVEYAERCLTVSAKARYIQEIIVLYGVYKPVLRAGLERGIEVGFVQEMLARVGKPALSLVEEMAGHPDPQIKRRAAVPLAHAPDLALGPNTPDENSRIEVVRDRSMDVVLAEIAASVELDSSSGVLAADDYPLLNIRCFGQFRVSVGGKDILPEEWRTTKSRDLLAYLVHRKQPVQSLEILTDLWPDSDPDQSRAVLHTNLYYLRKTLQILVGRRETVVFGGGYY